MTGLGSWLRPEEGSKEYPLQACSHQRRTKYLGFRDYMLDASATPVADITKRMSLILLTIAELGLKFQCQLVVSVTWLMDHLGHLTCICLSLLLINPSN